MTLFSIKIFSLQSVYVGSSLGAAGMFHFYVFILARLLRNAPVLQVFSTRDGTSSHGTQYLHTRFPPGVCGKLSICLQTRETLCLRLGLAGADADSGPFRRPDPGWIPDVPEPLCPEGGGQPPSTGDVPSQMPRLVLEVSRELLQSGLLALPGEHGRSDKGPEAPSRQQTCVSPFREAGRPSSKGQHSRVLARAPPPGSLLTPLHCVLTWWEEWGGGPSGVFL